MASSYTEAETDKLVDLYTRDPCLDTVLRLTVIFNRPKKSIISKLVKEGVYVRIGYRTKTGGIPITKLQLVRSIEEALDIKLPDLAKAPKTTLQILSTSVFDQAVLLEDALGEVPLEEQIKRALN